MSHDFAKKRAAQKSNKAKPKSAPRKSSNKKSSKAKAPEHNSSWMWFVTGFIGGVFVCALAYISGIAPKPQELAEQSRRKAQQQVDKPAAKPRFDFYIDLQQKIELPPVAAIEPERQSTPISHYLLQAGSFRRNEDADRRRAELILLGLDATISETHGSNGKWYRVQVGPFESRSKLAKARSVLANKGIDTLLMKRK